MSKKLIYSEVFDYFRIHDCELLEQTYKDNRTSMITHCICYNISFEDILKLPSLDNIGNKCKMCNPYITESIKTGITKFPIDYFKNYDKLKKDELEN